MSSTKSGKISRESAAKQPLPEGYLWRLCVVLALSLGGCVCLLFYSAILGSLICLASVGFGKVSGLGEMVADYQKKNAKP